MGGLAAKHIVAAARSSAVKWLRTQVQKKKLERFAVVGLLERRSSERDGTVDLPELRPRPVNSPEPGDRTMSPNASTAVYALRSWIRLPSPPKAVRYAAFRVPHVLAVSGSRP